METKLNIIFLANFLLFLHQRNVSEAAECAVIEARGRERCGARRVSQASCEKQGCCWDRNARGSTISCYSKKCKAGYFGWRCRFQCHCHPGETCDRVTGQCPSECPENRWGIGCLLSSECTYNDPNGEHYKGRRTRTDKGNTCVQWTRQSSYGASRFSGESQADAANFCRNPDPHSHKPWCYYRLYRPSRGRYDYCTISPCRCLRGRYGVNCESECHCSQASDDCQLRDGQCQYGCAPYYTGPTCQACSDGRFGVNCQFQCNCKDTDEVCDNVDGRCQSGCRTNYTGDSCLMETPMLTRPPRKVSRMSDSITLDWLPWTRPPDLGEGPVTGYKVYYKKRWGKVEWQKTSSTQELHMVIENLRSRVNYQFKVVPLHGHGFEGRASPVATSYTCGAPTRAVQDLHIEMKDKEGSNLTTLTVIWQLPDSRYWNCDKIVRYRVMHNAVRRPEYVHDRLIEIPDVNMYENYKISVTLINNANRLGTLTSITYVARSGPVRDVRMSEVTATSMRAHWSAPATTVGDMSHYSVSYEVTQLSDCPARDVTASPLQVDISSHQLTYELSGLQPCSQYRVAVWVETASGPGRKTFTTVTTLPSAPTAEVKGLYRAEVRSFLARLAWQTQPCEGRNGPFLTYKYSVWQQRAPAVQYNGVVNVTEVRLVDLVPYTTYLAQVWYVNHIGEGPRCAPLEFQTLQGRPPAPRSVSLLNMRSDSMIVSWQPPSPSHGVITAYEVKHSPVVGESHPWLITLNDHILQHRISHLTINKSYQVQVRAYTSVGPGLWSEIIIGVTKESYPEKPGSLTNVSRTTSSVTLRWTQPMNTNGEIQKFKVRCEPVISSSMHPEFLVAKVEVLASQQEMTVEDLQSGRPYICSVAASTLKGYGPTASMTVWTKPLAPVRPGQPELLSAKSTDTTISLRLHSDKQLSGLTYSSRTYRVVVEELPPSTRRRRAAPVTPCGLTQDQLLPYEDARSRGYRCYVTAELGDLHLPEVFVVGDNRTYGGFHNIPLQKEHHYNVWFGVVVVVDGETAVSFVRTETPVVAGQFSSAAGMGMPFILVAIIAPIVILILIVIIVVAMTTRRKTQTEQKQCQATSAESELLHVPPPIQASPDQVDSVLLPDVCCTEEEPVDYRETALLCANPASQSKAGHSKPVALRNLCSYVKEKKAGRINELVQEFDDLPHGLRGKSVIAKDPENKLKNRYGNIIAYDHSRVVLDDHPLESNLGYINGNYIDGYKRPNAYIATQGPSKHTMGDIWKMAWQRNSHCIIMVTNLVEDGRRKCEQYWPDTDSATYVDFEVTKIEEEQYADFTIRVFSLSRGVITKTIRQFHFTSWPDHGVPMYATSLLAFRKKVRAFDDPTAGPTIVHCSAGVGRTGTFIALDYLLDQAKAEGCVDVLNCVYNMRMRRVNMVQTQEQYVFVYDALLEAFKSGDTAMPCVDFRKRFLELSRVNPQTGKLRLLEEYELLQAMSPVNTTSSCQDAVASENISKNRNMQILPLDNVSRPYIQMYIPLSTDYINAVFSDGYKQRDAFIITQMPLPNTVSDFWAMMIDHKCKSIVMMNEINPADETSACYFPDEGASWAFGPFTVKTVSVETVNTDVTIRNLTVTYNKKPGAMHSVQQFHYHGWPEDSSLPTSLSSLISLLSVVQRWQQRSGNRPIVVHCMDGATRSGLFCAVSYMVEHLKVEQEVDVFQSIKHVRINRPQLIPTFEQYKFLYEMAVEYMDCFETYSNFK